MIQDSSIFERFNNWSKRSVTLKLISISILILLLLIPSSMLNSLISERKTIRDKAIDEVSSKWGEPQTIGGPVISIPYKTSSKDKDGNSEIVINYAHFLPENLTIEGTVVPEKRYRGIYVVVLYTTHLHIKGSFKHPEPTALGISPFDCLTNQAKISIGISDLKGIHEDIKFNMNDTVYSFDPGITTHDIFESGASFNFNLKSTTLLKFDFDLTLNGSSSLNFIPFGKETTVKLTSQWDNPSFEGSFLPSNREIKANGFTASWKILQLNRNYPQQGLGDFIQNSEGDKSKQYDSTEEPSKLSAFGVKLLLPIDEYQKTTRSVKYCTMLILITFLSFFFVEVLNKKRIHPIQYLLVGFAICIFYVLLLSISEHLKFDTAYLIGTVSTVSLITFYAKNVFNNTKLVAIFSGVLTLLYGFFYSLMQMENYSMLIGSIGLFLILFICMYITRKVDWYGISSGSEDKKS